MEGYGILTISNGEILEGTFVSGLAEGEAKLTLPDGTVKVGPMVLGKPHGEFIETRRDGIRFRIFYVAGVIRRREPIE
jgi:hypothetical protein